MGNLPIGPRDVLPRELGSFPSGTATTARALRSARCATPLPTTTGAGKQNQTAASRAGSRTTAATWGSTSAHPNIQRARRTADELHVISATLNLPMSPYEQRKAKGTNRIMETGTASTIVGNSSSVGRDPLRRQGEPIHTGFAVRTAEGAVSAAHRSWHAPGPTTDPVLTSTIARARHTVSGCRSQHRWNERRNICFWSLFRGLSSGNYCHTNWLSVARTTLPQPANDAARAAGTW